MKKIKCECENCLNSFTVVSDCGDDAIAFCPFCGEDILMPELFDDEEDDLDDDEELDEEY